MEVLPTNMHIVSTTLVCTEQKWDMTCQKLASQLCHNNKSNFNSVTMSANGILQKQQYVHVLKHDITMALHSLVPTILHEFHDSENHQGPIHTYEAIRSFWCP